MRSTLIGVALCSFIILWMVQHVIAVESEVYYDAEVYTCKANEYFDVDYLNCKKCETELNLVPSKDKLSCVCSPVDSEKAFYDNLEQHSICDNKCKNCAGQQNSTNREPRITCKILYFNLTSVRQQSRNVKMYRLFDNSSCSCDERMHTLYREVYCIPNSLLKEYSNYGQATISRTITENMKALLFLCHTMKLRRECNYLANLCILLEYSLDKQSPCSIFYQAQINDYTSESTARIKPNLFYKKGRNTVEDINKKLDQSFVILRKGEQRPGLGFNFSILEFNLRGDLLKFGRSNLKFLNLCAMQNGYVEIFFPENIHNRCKVSLEETIENIGETTFNSIFIQYHDGKTRLLKRIPVLIKNLFQNDATDSKKWQFVSRFYLINTITGHRPGHFDNPYSERNMVKKFESIRYLKRAELRFETREFNKIETPILILQYDFVNLSAYGSDFMYDFEFHVTFEKSINFDTLFEILFPILLVIGLILAITETISYKIRDGKQFFDGEILVRFLVQFASKVANTLFLIAAGIAGYIHVVYKTQNTVKILLPDGIEQEIKYFLIVALVLKTVKLVQHLHTMLNVTIFFVDCERPKLGENCLVMKNHHLETPSSVGSRNINLEGTSASLPSAWRNYFIANEWLELTTKRPISVFLHLFCVLTMLCLVGVENFASDLLYFHLKRPEPNTTDVILKVSTGLFCFLVVYVVQWLFNYLIWERYVKNPLVEFIDVCCFSNVSVFLFSQRCFGYYIHGRSPHGFADTDVCSMILQFKREEDNLCGHRGLLPGSDTQIFRILVPKNLRVFYDRLVMPIQKPAFFTGNGTTTNVNGQPILHAGNGIEYANKLNDRYQYERTLNTYQSINRFFMAFIDHSLKDLDYVVRERTILEWLLNTELELSTVTDDRGIFYMDNGHSFDEVLFYGSESLLFQFEIFLFAAVICLSGNFIAAIIVVGLTYRFLKFTTATIAKYNLARKTLIDKRFLI